MSFQRYLSILRKRWLSIAVLAVVGTGVAVALCLVMTPMYVATTQMYVSVQGGASTTDLLQGSNYARQQVTSYVKMVNSPKVLAPVVQSLGLKETVEELETRVSASSPLDSSLITVSVTDPSAASAAATANAIAAEFKVFVNDLETPAAGGDSQVKLSVVRDADVPTSPASPDIRLYSPAGLLIGIALGVAAAMLRETLDTRLRSANDLAEVTDLAVVGTIAFDEKAADEPLVVRSDPHAPRSEDIRRLRTNLQFLDVSNPARSIVITSAVPDEGKTTLAMNLAVALSDTGARVAVVEADLRRPALATYTGLTASVGLTTVLIGQARLRDVMQPWGGKNLDVLTAGEVPPNPSEMLGSAAMALVLDQLTSSYDVVLVDAPPLLPVTDAAVLSRATAGTLVVVGVGSTRTGQLTKALSSLSSVDARVLGLVLNGVRRGKDEADSYYGYYGHRSPGGADPSRTRRHREAGRGQPVAVADGQSSRPTRD